MSCTVMYQPYAMSYSSCDRSGSEKQKLFKFSTAPSPPDSLHSDTSSYNSPGPLSVGTGSSSAASATLTVNSQSQTNSQTTRRPLTPATITSARGSSSSSTLTSSSTGTIGNAVSSGGSGTASATATSTNTNSGDPTTHQQQEHESSVSHSHRAHYLSANCVVFVHYNGDVSRVVDEHFSRALSSAYSNDKSSKSSPMSTRNFPPSFWNSNYQPSKPLASYGAAEFYGAAVEYGPPIPGLSHHHQADPWHYPLPPHQGYHHRPTEIPYPPMPSSSRFNAAQYGSFLLAGASSSAGRFAGMPSASQCGVKSESGPWVGGRYHHDTLSDLHLADYSAAAAAHYSNMTAGLETTVQDSSKDLYWF
ncbi:unnamed protein product [Allacma fusca]|uniref:Vestigial n=1 Tax=Allacma fusca TaxID=39272 RepID=A0A8J2Q6D2_9HEXA|nr:unnamed protein product [Allacma fusca]